MQPRCDFFLIDNAGFHYYIFVLLKSISGILLVTLIVSVNDYFQDFVWAIGYTGYILEGKNSDLLSQLILWAAQADGCLRLDSSYSEACQVFLTAGVYSWIVCQAVKRDGD
jgi:hypothetical protein